MTIDEYFGSWMRVIDRKELIDMNRFISRVYKRVKVMPSMTNVYRAFKKCPYDKLRICLLGQDPYPQKDIATGLAFANKKETTNISPSLEVLKNAVIDFSRPHNYINFDITLESWAEQGVLLLNSALTVQQDKVGSHSNMWRGFTSKLIENMSKANPAMVFILFGNRAQSFEPYISKNCYVLKEYHPAWYAREHKDMPHTVFEQADTIMRGLNGDTIKWYNEYRYGE